jgi:hypothetical protein
MRWWLSFVILAGCAVSGTRELANGKLVAPGATARTVIAAIQQGPWPAIPPHVETRARDDAARWTRFLAEQQGALEAALDAANDDTPGRVLSSGDRTTVTNHVARAWVENVRRVVVMYASTFERVSVHGEMGPPASGCDKYNGRFRRTPCEPLPPGDVWKVLATRSYGASLALVLEYDAEGQLVASRRFDPIPEPGQLR